MSVCSQDYTCKCGSQAFRLLTQTTKAGDAMIRMDCASCETFIRFVPKTRPNLSLVEGKYSPPTRPQPKYELQAYDD